MNMIGLTSIHFSVDMFAAQYDRLRDRHLSVDRAGRDQSVAALSRNLQGWLHVTSLDLAPLTESMCGVFCVVLDQLVVCVCLDQLNS